MNLPIAIIDKRAPEKAKQTLAKEFSVFEFISKNITYDAICGHPDVFITHTPQGFILAPNSPQELRNLFKQNNIKHTIGNKSVGIELENSSQFNCIVSENYIFHKQGFTDKSITQAFNNKKHINVPQAYTRCSMIQLPNGSCITSDKGIQNTLNKHNINNFYCNPSGIMLPPYKHGFIGGTMGIYKNCLYIIGNLNLIKGGGILRNFIQQQNIVIKELYDGSLSDGGGLFFVDQTHSITAN